MRHPLRGPCQRSRQALLARVQGRKASISGMGQRIYLDWNATALLRPQARAAMAAAMDVVGNPSSVHAEGRAARRLIEDAREKVAAAVGADPRNVIFTSGGSEANALAFSRNLEDQHK